MSVAFKIGFPLYKTYARENDLINMIVFPLKNTRTTKQCTDWSSTAVKYEIQYLNKIQGEVIIYIALLNNLPWFIVHINKKYFMSTKGCNCRRQENLSLMHK